MLVIRLLLLLSLCSCTHAEDGSAGQGDFPASPQRIVVLGPCTVANLYAMGLGARIVGVSDYCTVAEASELPRIGGLADPSLERILALNPDLVLAQGAIPRLERLCATSGIAFHAFTTDTLEEWYAEIGWLEEHLGVEGSGMAAATEMREGLASLAVDDLEQPPTVLLVIFRRKGEASGMTVAGDTGFLDELLRAAGGLNVLQGNNRDYFELNEERLIRAAPQWILEFHTEDVGQETRRRLDEEALRIWQRDFPGLPAVKNGNIRTLVGRDLLIPGPGMLATARQIRQVLQ